MFGRPIAKGPSPLFSLPILSLSHFFESNDDIGRVSDPKCRRSIASRIRIRWLVTSWIVSHRTGIQEEEEEEKTLCTIEFHFKVGPRSFQKGQFLIDNTFSRVCALLRHLELEFHFSFVLVIHFLRTCHYHYHCFR